MHGALRDGVGKMGLGLLRYSEAEIVAVIDRAHAGQDAQNVTGIARRVPIVATVEEAVALGADTLVPGVAPAGGRLPPEWREEIKTALQSELSLVNGLHARMGDDPDFAPLLHPDRFLWDVRQEPPGLPNGTGAARALACQRVLTVGTDMAVGKMTASIELDRAARRRGLQSKFIASGQIGLCIAGDRTPLASGVALDAIRVDFASGAIEATVLFNAAQYGQANDLLSIEGQGSILHPASTAWLPLIRGACPTHLILTHRAGQTALARFPDIKIPSLSTVCSLYENVCAAGGTQPPARVVGIALNCGHLSDEEARQAVAQTHKETDLPVVDVVRDGADALLDAIYNIKRKITMTALWGIIGCGDVCEVKSGPGFKNVEGSELVAVMRRDKAKAEEYARRHFVPVWSDKAHDIITHPKVSAVYIATPPGSHLEYALQVCAAGKPAYVEKPMARSASECRQMTNAFDRAGLPLFVAYYRRALPRFLKAKELLDTGRIGTITNVAYRFATPAHRDMDADNLPWRVVAEQSGGGLFLDLGCHTLDILDFLLGPLQNARGIAANLASPYDVEDNVAMLFQTPGGASGTAQWNFAAHIREDIIEISGTDGRITLSTFGNEPVRLQSIHGDETFDLPNPLHIQQPLIQTIVDQLAGRGECPSTGHTATRTSEVIDAVLGDYYAGRDDAFWTRPQTWENPQSATAKNAN